MRGGFSNLAIADYKSASILCKIVNLDTARVSLPLAYFFFLTKKSNKKSQGCIKLAKKCRFAPKGQKLAIAQTVCPS